MKAVTANPTFTSKNMNGLWGNNVMERISRGGQIQVYMGKCFRLFINERGYKLLVSAAIIAVIISWVSGDDMFRTFSGTRSGAFALVCACIWIGVFNSIQSICRERAIIKREYRTGLYISSYITAHMLYEMILCFVQALIVTIIVLIIRDAPSSGVFLPAGLELFITFFWVIYSADVLGMAVSCIVKNETAAMTAMPFVLIIQLVMSGAVFSLDGAASVISHFTISRWGVNAICTTANVANMPEIFWADVNRADFEFVASNLIGMWFTLIAFTLLYGIIGILFLKSIDKDKR